jgi:hypothetical protein
MRARITLLLLTVCAMTGITDRAEARWRRRNQCVCCPEVACVPSAPTAITPRSFREGPVTDGDVEEERPLLRRTPADFLRRLNVAIPEEDIWNGSDRAGAKTSVVHGGEHQTFDGVNELIEFFELPDRKQEKWWRKDIKQSTDQRNEEIEMVNVTVKDAWIYEISRQKDCDYHLLISVDPNNHERRYLNAEISSINLDSPDAMQLWNVRKSFRQQYRDHTGRSLPTGKSFTQPTPPIHIRLTGSIFLDADHGRRAVGHHDIKNFTSWEIHPITKIEIVD